MTLKGSQQVLAWLGLLYVANVVSVQWGGYPFLYCWGKQVVMPLYAPWSVFAHVAALAYLGFALYRRGAERVLVASGVMLALFSLPATADALFRLGGSCGE